MNLLLKFSSGVYLMTEPVGLFETSVHIYRTIMRQIPAVNSLRADVSLEGESRAQKRS
jgi:hypothetical protein